MNDCEKLMISWVPQIPMLPFCVPVDSLKEAAKILDVLAAYDQFQYQHNVKGDYCNAGSLLVFDENDLTDSPDGSWVDWESDDGDSFSDWVAEQEWSDALSMAYQQMCEESQI